jgi:hypothetical protein
MSTSLPGGTSLDWGSEETFRESNIEAKIESIGE